MNNLISKSVKVFTVSALSAVLWVGTSHAGFVLKVQDVTNGITTTVTDNGAGDLSAIAGFINAMVITPNASIVTSIGTSKPLGGNSNIVALMDLLNVDITSNSALDLVISLTDTDFDLNGIGGPGFGLLGASIGGTMGSNPLNSLQVDYFFNTSNVEFDTVGATSISSNNWNGPGAFGENVARTLVNPVNAPFSLTQIATIHLEANQIISYDSEVTVVPEPSVLFLMGLGLIGLTVANRRKVKSV